ncbi:MAG: efflux RND transporter periplasmic adaptor subunit [Candidatus Aminicenantes bacterium]|nr:efflux RND transporter periplasmic adaptor subunit [Candidatus Aminicenantes bacterium]
MIKKSIIIILTGLLGLFFCCCDNSTHSQSQTAGEKDSVKKNIPGQGKSEPGRGAGRRGRERKRSGVPAEEQVVHLSVENGKQIDIKTAVVKPGMVKSTLKAMGKVLAPNNRTAIVGFSCSARIEKLHTEVGSWVKAGQPLLTLQCTEVGGSQSDFVKALTDHELARLDFQREERLFKKDIGAEKELLEAKGRFHIATANLKAAKEKLAVLGLSKTQIAEIAKTKNVSPTVTVNAPITGWVTRNSAVLGAMIDSATEIMTVMDLTDLWIDAGIYEKDLSKVRLGQEVEISVPAYPDKKFFGKIHYIGAVVNSDTRTITVRTKVNNRDLKLKPGMFAGIDILTGSRQDALIVPKQAVLDDGSRKIIFVLDVDEEDHFICRVVEVGAVYNGDIEIVKGLKSGEIVVIEGNFQLKSRLYAEDIAAHTH